MNLKICLFYVLIISFSVCFSQSRIYLDHNGKEITKKEADNLVKNRLIYAPTYIKEKDTISKITLLYQFGKMSQLEHSQIKSLISQRTSTSILDDEYLIIAYIDTLYNFQSHIQKLNKKFNRNLNIGNSKTILDKIKEQSKITKNQFEKLQIKKFESWEKCKANVEKKYNAKVFHLSNINNLDNKIDNELRWITDNGIIKNMFLKYDVSNRIIIIKPDGSYLISRSCTKELLKQLIKNKDWSDIEQQLFEILKNNSAYNNKSIFYYNRKKDCFK